MAKVKKAIPEYRDLFFSKTDQFLNLFLVRQTGKSRHTAKQYRTGLSQFFEYIVKTRRIDPMMFCFSDITYEFLLDYSEYLQNEKKLAPATVNVRLAAIREYLKYVSDGDISLIQYYIISERVPNLTLPIRRRPLIYRDDLAVLLASPKNTRLGNRDHFILIILYDSAIRVSELLDITLGDITVIGDKVCIQIHGKGRKERSITLSSKAAPHAIAYLKAFHSEPWDPDMPLIYTVIHGRRNRMSVRNVERILEKYGKITKETNPNTPGNVYPHMMRRCRATYLYQDGVPIQQVSALLGHSQIETTRSHYAYVSDEQLKKMMDKAVSEEPEFRKEWEGKTDEIKRRFGLIK